MNMLKDLTISQLLGYFAAGTTKRTSDILDMAGYDGVIFVAHLGTLITAGTLDVYVEQNTANSTSGMARLATTTVHTVTSGDAALTQSCVIVEVFRPVERYLQLNITPATQNAVVLGVSAWQYNARLKPRTVAASCIQSTILHSPAEA